MQALKAIPRTLGLIFLLGALFGIFNIAVFVLESPKNDHLSYIPADAELVLHIHSKEILKKTIESLFIDSQDDQLLNALFKKSVKRLKSDSKDINNGIDFSSNIALFKLPFKSSYVIGFLFNLHSPNDFEKRMSQNFSAKRVAITKKNVGLILEYRGLENNRAMAIELEQLATTILLNSNQTKQNPIHEGTLISMEGTKGKMNLSIEKNALLVNGTFSLNSSFRSASHLELKEKGFHFSCNHITEIPSSLNGFPIDYVNINFLGYGTSNGNGFPDLHLELLMGFKGKIDFIDAMKQQFGGALQFNENEQEVSIMNQTFHYKKLNDSIVYIGSTLAPSIRMKDQKSIFRVSGNPSTIFAYKADGIALALIEMSPLFQAIKQLAIRMSTIDIDLIYSNANQLKVHGEIKFKQESFPINEIVRFLMSANLRL
jgi:hypothetical protein